MFHDDLRGKKELPKLPVHNLPRRHTFPTRDGRISPVLVLFSCLRPFYLRPSDYVVLSKKGDSEAIQSPSCCER